MALVDNRIDQSEFKKGKGLTDKTYCNQCKRYGSSLMYMNTAGRLVCASCAGVEAPDAEKKAR